MDPSKLEERLFAMHDANYNVTGIVDAEDGDVVERYVETPYGTVTYLNPDWTTDTAGSDFYWDRVHQGLMTDAETGLVYNRARYLQTSMGRFLIRDLIGYGDGMNLYQYVAASPIGLLDPTGEGGCGDNSYYMAQELRRQQEPPYYKVDSAIWWEAQQAVGSQIGLNPKYIYYAWNSKWGSGTIGDLVVAEYRAKKEFYYDRHFIIVNSEAEGQALVEQWRKDREEQAARNRYIAQMPFWDQCNYGVWSSLGCASPGKNPWSCVARCIEDNMAGWERILAGAALGLNSTLGSPVPRKRGRLGKPSKLNTTSFQELWKKLPLGARKRIPLSVFKYAGRVNVAMILIEGAVSAYVESRCLAHCHGKRGYSPGDLDVWSE